MVQEKVKHLKSSEFKRFWGVKQETFEQMVEIVRLYKQNKQKPGRPGKITLEDQVLMTLEYWREYRTYFHTGLSWGVAESTACRIIRKVENILRGCLKRLDKVYYVILSVTKWSEESLFTVNL